MYGVRVERDVTSDRDEGNAPRGASPINPFDQLWAELVDEHEPAGHREDDGQGNRGTGGFGAWLPLPEAE